MTKKNKKLLLFAGLPGTGKSYCARILKNKLNGYYFDSDKFAKDVSMTNFDLEKASDAELLEWRIESQKNKIEIIKKLFKENDIVIIDTCLDLPESRKLYFELDEICEVIVIEVRCDEEIVKKRIFESEHEQDRQVGTPKSRFEIYKKMKEKWRDIEWKNHFVLSSEENVEEQIITFIKEYNLS